MKKSEVIMALQKTATVAVIRGNTHEDALQAAKACIDGGMTAIELTYTNPKASEIISELASCYSNQPNILIGAGTVLDAETARLAILAGASYIVSPSFHRETARLCNRYAIPYIPGCMTLTEMVTALEAGCEIVKLFPGSMASPSYIKAIKAPLPQLSIMVTGGVNLSNALDWFEAGADMIGIGGDFNTFIAQGDFATIKELAKQYSQLLSR
ncbi:bifunctional 4-hydroxy-2-oxoglutarate aldolase/2-dehydro-3-deoxy-phosphogluconate aldolase [Streptococcus ovuberis]|uniref:Bifunctional 4-hydroxy-2-oxoglutarate aldolase/2-dehydro-3-deoxy-phosphogluconate aldolase n=1 Tax=Streptococcus ovuberis TaxID=1936207 RepID=A0A7X6MYB7_9STRE|nr:bifunctional 4-hydroxy-2-oxoglutarate aldolase/2-dehydro-3-deoxy-phosphogluconate aldolase [Streptococcus ovuberis]NKZ20667.1 bifunctional 4-hydroxy-2-oxoglutarate aldolase/2-dehydro-3-deoxy-phosphogluconate aldolase [Streptococcus ovuberis]